MSEETFDQFEATPEAFEQPERRSRRRGRRKGASLWPQLELNFDVPMALAIFALVVFGLLMVYSASWDFSLSEYDDPTFMFRRQMVTMTIGLVGGLAAYFIDYRFWRKYAIPLIAGTIISLLVVLVVNEVRFGSARALSGGSYMPGEVAKVATILYLSVWLSSKREQLAHVGRGIVPLGAIVGLMAGLILLQPDFSAAATMVVLGGMMFFLAGGSIKQIIFMLAGASVLASLFVSVSTTSQVRISSYLDSLQDPTQANSHVLRSFEAFVKGGWFGVGIGLADTKLTGLPVPPTDSIFAVVGEELGLVGCAILALLYGVVLWRGMVIAHRAPDMLGALIAGGITVWITMEAFINMGVMVGLLPFAGNALPLISFGGSSLVSVLGALGVVMSVSRTSSAKSQKEERIIDATTRGRRGERGWGLSRARRASRIGRN
ncbi:MAG: cell division protein FtsW [Anaerolineales bacterium]|nr:MAG: cell division protein FtsW [Anaerolineales bacterium]